MKYDIVVVGGRIAGSVSSLFASKNGAEVLMIEKRQEIGTPVQCAEATSFRTFDTLGFKPSDKYVCTRIDGAKIHAPDGTTVKVEDARAKGLILERKVFDKELAIKSAQAGTDIMVKTKVNDLIIENGKVCGVVAKHLNKIMEIRADVVIAADGVESQIARLAGLNTYQDPNMLCSCAQYEMVGLDVHPNYLEFFFGKNLAPGGYVWVFPKGEGVANVGVGVRSDKETAYHFLQKFVANLSATPIELNIGGVPLSGPFEKTYASGLLVVGDAAGQVDPVTGGGIHITAECARIAGEIAAKSLEREDSSEEFLKEYEKTWKNRLGNELKNSLKYRKVIDKISDDEINALANFFKDQDYDSLSKLSILKLVKNYPNLLTLLKDLL